MAQNPVRDLLLIGWREWIALPSLGVRALKVKIDTGARSSALHVEWQEATVEQGAPWVRFGLKVDPDSADEIICRAAVHDRRPVTDSGGHRTERVFILAEVQIAGSRWAIETNLTNRRGMLFPMLLGRTAIAGHLRVDPARSFVLGQPSRKDSP